MLQLSRRRVRSGAGDGFAVARVMVRRGGCRLALRARGCPPPCERRASMGRGLLAALQFPVDQELRDAVELVEILDLGAAVFAVDDDRRRAVDAPGLDELAVGFDSLLRGV